MAYIKWDHDSAIAEARQHPNRASLFRSAPGAYQYLKRHRLLDGLLPRLSRKKWTYAKIKTLCLEHRIPDKKTLALMCPTALRACYRNYNKDGTRWIDTLFPSDGQ